MPRYTGPLPIRSEERRSLGGSETDPSVLPGIPPWVLTALQSSGRALPFRLGGEGLARPAAVLDGIGPGHTDHGVLVLADGLACPAALEGVDACKDPLTSGGNGNVD